MSEKILLIIIIVILLAIIAVLCVVINRMRRDLNKKETLVQLMENRASISQIRPHFLYNCLNSIYYLCDEDPIIAKDAISNFSEYLRDDLEALSGETTVPFTKELEHIKRYVRLEKLRFGDDLNIEYDIGYTDFCLPVLSVQPIVENAIKHGAVRRKGQGTVKLTTTKLENEVIITVTDDGDGFDTNTIDPTKAWVDSKGKKHVGMSNVHARIINLANGRIEFDSKVGRGTKVIIYIPAQKNSKS